MAAADEPVAIAEQRIAWAAERTWERRTEAWLDATLGDRLDGVTGVNTTITS